MGKILVLGILDLTLVSLTLGMMRSKTTITQTQVTLKPLVTSLNWFGNRLQKLDVLVFCVTTPGVNTPFVNTLMKEVMLLEPTQQPVKVTSN